jgi:acyl-CoA synthetase (NDP forming)
VLAGAGIPVMSERLVTSADDAAAAANDIGYPVAMKIVSPDIAHKTEIGGVLLDVASADEARRGYAALQAAAAEKAPAARVSGVAVAPMASEGSRRSSAWCRIRCSGGLVKCSGSAACSSRRCAT